MEQAGDETLPYRVGGLLYIPALKEGVAEHIGKGDYKCLTSVAFCLEDSIMDEALEEAERHLYSTLCALLEIQRAGKKLPLIFIRVRSVSHLERASERYRELFSVITGFILPKFGPGNAVQYAEVIGDINRDRLRPLYFMPIIESAECIALKSRAEALYKTEEILRPVRKYILNIRVGGNDFSNLYGLRRHADETIYDMAVIRDALTDILNVFSGEYVVSGPVWEYFDDKSGDAWKKGLERELKADRANGFLGKTCIHPSQLPVVYESMKVLQTDYDDACAILGWKDGKNGVGRVHNRMNEVKCHLKWARKIQTLGEIYGIRLEE